VILKKDVDVLSKHGMPLNLPLENARFQKELGRKRELLS
jgi:hypothetical protein